jgi:uncharacterized membrane protein
MEWVNGMSPVVLEAHKVDAEAAVKVAESQERATVATAAAKATSASAIAEARKRVAEENTKAVVIPAQEETKRDKTKVFATMGVVLIIVGVTTFAVPQVDRAKVLEVCAGVATAAWMAVEGIKAWARRKPTKATLPSA